jgi:oligopeptide transport system permease protein
MRKYILRRLFHTVISLFVLSFLVFTLLRLMPIEGYFTREEYESTTPEQRELILIENGIKGKPIEGYFNYMKGAIVFDFGRSNKIYPDVPIAQLIKEKAPYSATLGAASMAISITLGCLMGLGMARGKNKWPDAIGTGYIVTVRAVPRLVYLFFIQVWITGLFMLPLLFYSDRPESWIMPIISLSLGSIAWYATWLRRFLIDEENRDYIKLARAKGLDERYIYRKHIFRNAIVPLVHYLPAQLLLTISGSLIIESLYSIPGLGGLLLAAINEMENGLVLALVLIFSTLSVIGIFIGDILMAYVDPRIKLSEEAQ